MLDAVRFRAADVDVPAGNLPQGLELLRRFVHHVQDVLRPAAQQHPLVRQPDAEAASYKELFAQLRLQIFELLGQGGLGDMEPFCSVGDAALPGYLQKIAQDPNFHDRHLRLQNSTSCYSLQE